MFLQDWFNASDIMEISLEHRFGERQKKFLLANVAEIIL